jgi:hypothetical protein
VGSVGTPAFPSVAQADAVEFQGIQKLASSWKPVPAKYAANNFAKLAERVDRKLSRRYVSRERLKKHNVDARRERDHDEQLRTS